MYTIRIIGLPGCEQCSILQEKLQDEKITYGLVDATANDSLCDMLEALLQTKKYPIVTFEIPSRVYFICMPETADRLGWKALDDNSTSIGTTSVSEILNTILELKNKL